MLRKWLCQADVTLHLEPCDPLLIKSGIATLDGPDMVPVCMYRETGGPNLEKTYYVPGSSLKGVLRSHLERIVRTLGGAVCIPYHDKKDQIKIPVESEKNAFGCGYRDRKRDKPTAYAQSCPACRLFGSLQFAGRLSISDALPVKGKEPKAEQRNGVGIDRFTGGTVPAVLFDLLVLVGGTFETKMRLINFELWQLAALNFLLHDLHDEIIFLGSGRSRGLGRVRGQVIDYRLSYLKKVTHLQGIGEMTTDDKERRLYDLHRFAFDSQIALPTARRVGLRHEYDLTGSWADTLAPLAPTFDGFLEHFGPHLKGAI